MSRKLTTEEFVKRSNFIHDGKYDYSISEYKSARENVCIICPEHGKFWQKAQSHLNGHGCPKCGGTGKLTTDEFIEKSMRVHGNKYDYSKVEYVGAKGKVCIVCPEHGEFLQVPNNHLNGYGCPKCAGRGLSQDEIIERFRSVHGDKYDYSKVVFTRMRDKVCIICPEHGEFLQSPSDHIFGCGCPKCGNTDTWDKRGRITTDEFIEKSMRVHGNKYDYSKVEYKNNRTKVCIICNKKHKNGQIHGEFWQTPNCHLTGNGCPKCRNSRLEENMMVLLKNNGIRYVTEKTFDWLKDKQKMFLDFYLPDYKVAIECQGIQHFIPIKRGKMSDEQSKLLFDEIKKRDNKKLTLCKKHGIRLLYFTNASCVEKWNDGLFKDIFYQEREIINKILDSNEVGF